VAETGNHFKSLMVLLQDGVFSEYTDCELSFSA